MYTKERIKPYIIQCMVMKLSEKESIEYLQDRGLKISVQHFYRLKKQIKELTNKPEDCTICGRISKHIVFYETWICQKCLRFLKELQNK